MKPTKTTMAPKAIMEITNNINMVASSQLNPLTKKPGTNPTNVYSGHQFATAVHWENFVTQKIPTGPSIPVLKDVGNNANVVFGVHVKPSHLSLLFFLSLLLSLLLIYH